MQLGKSLSVAVLISIFAVLPRSAFGQGSKAREIDNFLRPIVTANQFYGVVFVVQDGKIIYHKAFGLANADFQIPNQLNTRIGIASVTKPMTVVILSRLVEEKKIAMDDKLSKYLPDFPNGDKITIAMLRAHRSGIPHRVMRPEEESLPYTSTEFVEKVKQAKLAFEPNTQRLYSSAGFAVLARALEIASGKPYAQLLKEYVFAPAAMNDSVNFDSERVIERRAQDYLLDAKGVINASLKDYSFLVGAGSVFSTAADLYRFGEAVINGRFGETIKTSFAGDNEVSANGSTNGHRAYFKINRKKKWGFVIVSNLASGSNDVLVTNLEAILDGKKVTTFVVPAPKIIANANINLSEFTGIFRRTDSSGELQFTVKNNELLAGTLKLFPTGVDSFYNYLTYGDLHFVRDKEGKIKEVLWKSPDVSSTWVKQ